jgi:hypothetical protein
LSPTYFISSSSTSLSVQRTSATPPHLQEVQNTGCRILNAAAVSCKSFLSYLLQPSVPPHPSSRSPNPHLTLRRQIYQHEAQRPTPPERLVVINGRKCTREVLRVGGLATGSRSSTATGRCTESCQHAIWSGRGGELTEIIYCDAVQRSNYRRRYGGRHSPYL